MNDLGDLLGLLTILVTLVVSMVAVVVLARIARNGGLTSGLLRLALLPEKRARLAPLVVAAALFFLAGAVMDGLLVLGLTPDVLGDAGPPAFDLGAVIMLLTLGWVALRPEQLSDQQRASIAREAPRLMYSLALAPLEAFTEEASQRHDGY